MSTYKIQIKDGYIVYITQEEEFEYTTIYDMTFFSEDSLVFETSKPIWPKSITIYHPKIDLFVKSLSGKQQGMDNSIRFKFEKHTQQ